MRRERITLIGVVLEQLAASRAEPGGVRLTRVAMRCNQPYDRFRDLFHDLQILGLVERDPPYALTPEGLTLLEKYRHLHQALRDLGVEEVGSMAHRP